MSVENIFNASRPYVDQGENLNGARLVRKISEIKGLHEYECRALEEVTSQYTFQSTEYYLSLIDWDDPKDPIRRLIVPHMDELDDWGMLDACDEASNTQMHGVQHKYPDTALMLVTNNCAALCRYCFRKRLFLEGNREVNPDITRAIKYVSNHKEITDVLLTGGDPLTLPTRRIEEILYSLGKLNHVKAVRMGSKIPAFNPWRLTEDKKLQNAIADFSHTGKTLFLIAHFDHPRELTEEAKDQLRMFRELGVVIVNQCPILHGINDDPAILAELYNSLNSVGVAPYYLFQGRPTKGNAMFRVPLVKSYEIFHEAVSSLSGLAKRARLVMSHATGKIEIIGVDDSRIYMRYHRAKYEEDRERFMIFHRDDMAYWLDDLVPAESMIRQNESQWV